MKQVVKLLPKIQYILGNSNFSKKETLLLDVIYTLWMNHVKWNSMYTKNHIRQVSQKRASKVSSYNWRNVDSLLELLNIIWAIYPTNEPTAKLVRSVSLKCYEQNLKVTLIRTALPAWTTLPISRWFITITSKS